MVDWPSHYYSFASWSSPYSDGRQRGRSVYLYFILKLLLRKNIPLLLLIAILAIANLEGVLLLRHKSPYISDSYFYQHMVYQFLGDSPNQARSHVMKNLSQITLDKISSNFFYNEPTYCKTIKFFIKRPFYPLLVSIIYRITNQEYLSFAIPQFITLNIVLLVAYYLFHQGLTDSWAIISTALLAAFPSLIEWTTYFTGDLIGFCFWLSQVALLFKMIQKSNQNVQLTFLLVLSISLINREQSLLMNVVILIVYFSKKNQRIKKVIRRVLAGTILVTLSYLLFAKLTGQNTVLDTISYLRNNYGIYENTYTFSQNIPFILKSVIDAHRVILFDLLHHRWWLVIVIVGIIGTFFSMKKRRTIDVVMFASLIGSYVAIFIYPSFSYKYFFPMVTSFIYFSIVILSSVESKKQSHQRLLGDP